MYVVLGVVLGLAGLVLLAISPGLGVAALIGALLLFAAQGIANRRAKADAQRKAAERQHQESLAAMQTPAGRLQHAAYAEFGNLAQSLPASVVPDEQKRPAD